MKKQIAAVLSSLALLFITNCDRNISSLAPEGEDSKHASVSQYGFRNYSYTNLSGQSCIVRIYETNPSTQSVSPAVYTNGNKKFLADMNVPGLKPEKIMAKINAGGMSKYDATGDAFYGLYYVNKELYKDGYKMSGASDSKLNNLNNDKQYYPSFCIRTDGTTAIRWPNKSEIQSTINACRVIIGACHPLVYEGNNIFKGELVKGKYQSVRDNKDYIILDINDFNSKSDRFNTEIGWGQKKDMPRTFFGHKTDKSFILVVVEDPGMSLPRGAEMMKSLGCINAVAMDCNSASQMRVAGSGKVTTNGNTGTYYGTAVIVHKN